MNSSAFKDEFFIRTHLGQRKPEAGDPNTDLIHFHPPHNWKHLSNFLLTCYLLATTSNQTIKTTMKIYLILYLHMQKCQCHKQAFKDDMFKLFTAHYIILQYYIKFSTSSPERYVSCLLLLVIYLKSLRARQLSVEFSRAPSLAHFSSFTFLCIKGHHRNIF